MDEITSLKYMDITLENPSPISIIIGRNGSGKSRFLRTLCDVSTAQVSKYQVTYISPERAGTFQNEPGSESNIQNVQGWLRNVRHTNQANGFKNASAYFFKQLEMLFLRRLENDMGMRTDPDITFKNVQLSKINQLLHNIELRQSSGPKGIVFCDHSGQEIQPDSISSGESEVVALASEVLYFFETIDFTKINILALDEPDVHMHPDLQARFCRFLINEIKNVSTEVLDKIFIILATHSTPLICELSRSEFTTIGTKYFSNNTVKQNKISERFQHTLPFFGHPLSQAISSDPLLILEGEDDERVWQQASRTSKGKINFFPCLATTVSQQSELEKVTDELLTAIYDAPIAYSIRDGDGAKEDDVLAPVGVVKRYRLKCYAIENLLLSNECLAELGCDWQGFKDNAVKWLESNQQHKDLPFIELLVIDEERMRHKKIKNIRQLICGICGSLKPWEVTVGQTIGKLSLNDFKFTEERSSIVSFIGIDALKSLGFKEEQSSSLPT